MINAPEEGAAEAAEQEPLPSQNGRSATRRLLSRDDIRQADDLQLVEIQCPEWGGTVLCKPMRGIERDRFEASIMRGEGRSSSIDFANLRAKTVVQVCVNEDGSPMFTEEDVQWLGQKSAKPLDRIFSWAQQASGISPDDVAKYLGNFGGGLSEGSTSA